MRAIPRAICFDRAWERCWREASIDVASGADAREGSPRTCLRRGSGGRRLGVQLDCEHCRRRGNGTRVRDHWTGAGVCRRVRSPERVLPAGRVRRASGRPLRHLRARCVALSRSPPVLSARGRRVHRRADLRCRQLQPVRSPMRARRPAGVRGSRLSGLRERSRSRRRLRILLLGGRLSHRHLQRSGVARRRRWRRRMPDPLLRGLRCRLGCSGRASRSLLCLADPLFLAVGGGPRACRRRNPHEPRRLPLIAVRRRSLLRPDLRIQHVFMRLLLGRNDHHAASLYQRLQRPDLRRSTALRST